MAPSRYNVRVAAILGSAPEELMWVSALVIYSNQNSYDFMNTEAARMLAASSTIETDCEFERENGRLIWCGVCAKGLDGEHRERGTA